MSQFISQLSYLRLLPSLIPFSDKSHFGLVPFVVFMMKVCTVAVLVGNTVPGIMWNLHVSTKETLFLLYIYIYIYILFLKIAVGAKRKACDVTNFVMIVSDTVSALNDFYVGFSQVIIQLSFFNDSY